MCRVWVYVTVNCSNSSSLDDCRFSTLRLAVLRGSDRWRFVHIGVWRQWSTFCLRSHLLSISSAWQGVARNYQGLPELCGQSEGAVDLLTLVWQMPAVRHHCLPLALAVFRKACTFLWEYCMLCIISLCMIYLSKWALFTSADGKTLLVFLRMQCAGHNLPWVWHIKSKLFYYPPKKCFLTLLTTTKNAYRENKWNIFWKSILKSVHLTYNSKEWILK